MGIMLPCWFRGGRDRRIVWQRDRSNIFNNIIM
ncbi:hypothetical protein ACHAWC_001592 [Mediolabrus comicus]